MAQRSQQRLQAELAQWKELKERGVGGANTNISLAPLQGDLCEVHVAITGPPCPPYKGCTILLVVDVPPSYPFKAPAFRVTAVFFPRDTPDTPSAGRLRRTVRLALDDLRYHRWLPSITISEVALTLFAALADPRAGEDPMTAKIARLAPALAYDRTLDLQRSHSCFRPVVVAEVAEMLNAEDIERLQGAHWRLFDAVADWHRAGVPRVGRPLRWREPF